MNNTNSARADREERLGEIISDWLESREAGLKLDPDEWIERYPEFATELRAFFDDENQLRALVVPLREAAHEARVDTPTDWASLFTRPETDAPEPTLPVFADYELLEEIGRGGMAVVYRARQKSLGRFVALKLFRADCLDRPDELQRFRHEAEIVAHLDHALIVPVYAVGEANGRGFFTMKLMEGGGLDSQLSRFKSKPRAAAALVAAVAKAIHHAHQRGILHRDLKPSNILLSGDRKTPHVSDFGLAKRVGTESELTHSQAIVGTPAYMAPEQARSAKTAITTATDVYGLGAVLYALLTGRAPFSGGSVLEVLARVKEQDPEPPRRINARVPRDLETICLKCLRKAPHERYESAVGVAEDLERWLRGEPILARPVGALGRFWRWTRRQPIQAAPAGSLVLSILIGFGLVVWQWRQAEDNLATTTALQREAENNLTTMTGLRQNAETLRQEALDSKNEVTANFHLAHQAVREITGLAEGGGQLESHGLDPLRREILQRAQFFFEQFLTHRSQDPKLRLALAQSAASLADIVRQTGSPQEALTAYQRAIERGEAVQRDDPNNIQVNIALAMMHNQRASVQDALGHFSEALADLQRAGDILEKALTVHPKDFALKATLASTYHNRGRVYASSGRPDEALAAYINARTIYEQIQKLQPEQAEQQRLLANTWNSIGMIYDQRNQWGEAIKAFQLAVELSEPLVKRYPTQRVLKHGLAQQLCNLADAYSLAGEPKKAQEPLAQARPLLEDLVHTSPAVTDFHVALGLYHAISAQVFVKLGEHANGAEAFEQARLIYRRLVAEHPKIIEYQRRLSRILMDLGPIRTRLHQRDPALDTFREAHAVVARLAAAFPAEPDYQSRLGMILNNRAIAQAEMVSITDARVSVQEAINHQKQALDKRPTELAYRARLTSHYALLAALERESGHIEDAVEANKKRLNLWPNNGTELHAAARDFVLIGNAAKTDEAKQRCYAIAVETLQAAVKAGFRAAELTKDAIFAPLRTRTDFQKLVPALEPQKKPLGF